MHSQKNTKLPEIITTNFCLVEGANKFNAIGMKIIYLRSYNHALFIFLHIWRRFFSIRKLTSHCLI